MDLHIQGEFGVRLPSERMKKGDLVEGHAHNFGHLTYVAHGALLVEELDADDNVVRTVIKRAADGYNFVWIKAGVRHRLTALEDETDYHCIYVHRSPDGAVSPTYDGWMASYE